MLSPPKSFPFEPTAKQKKNQGNILKFIGCTDMS